MLDLFDDLRDGLAAVGDGAKVLGATVIRMQTCEAQRGVLGNGLGQFQRGFAWMHAAAALADVEFDEHVDDAVAVHIAQRAGEHFDADFGVHRDGQTTAARIEILRELGHAAQLRGGDDLVADVEVVHAQRGEDFGLGELLHAVADGTGLLQQQRDVGALVQLGVGTPAHAVLAREVGHALDVAVHGVEVDDERRGLDLIDRFALQLQQVVRNGFHRGFADSSAVCRPSRRA